MNTITKSILSSIAGSVVFLFFLFGLDASFLISVGTGLLSFGGTFLLISSLAGKPIEIEVQEYSDSYYRQTMNEGYNKVKSIRMTVNLIRHNKIKAQAENVLSLIDRILKRLEEDPKDAQSIREFFTYYLDGLETILQQCYHIEKQQLKGEDIDSVYKEVLKNLQLLEKFYEKQLKQLSESNLLKLDTEMKMMTNMLKSEGIKDE